MQKKSIVYLNYSPYENSGHILEYLLDSFEKVYLFSIAFHTLGNKSINKFSIYEKGKLIKDEHMFYMSIPEKLVVFFIPLRSIVNALQIIAKLVTIRRKYGSVEVFFTVNAFTATIGMLLKKMHIVKKTVFWVWDYYPMNHPSLLARVARWLYWQFDKFATYSDRVVYLHVRLAQLRKDAGVIDSNEKCIVVPLGMGEIMPFKKKNFNIIKIGFIGVLKKSQGLDMLSQSAETLTKYFKKISFEIIGSGPDAEFFKKEIKNTSCVSYTFYGLLPEEKATQILYDATVGIAPYMPDESSVSHYTDPGKPKRYIECNLPVIITNVVTIAKELEESGAGEIITYGDYENLANAIKKVIRKYDVYSKNVLQLHKKYYYKNIYPTLFALE